MSVKPRICVIGGGIFGLMHLRAFHQLKQEGRCEFLALADVSEKTRRLREQEFGVRTYADFREMLDKEKPHGVTIATPDHLHRAIAMEALNRGVHVFVEKPMDITVEGCREMVEAAASRGLVLEVDFHKRYDPYHQQLYRLAREGKLGQIEYGYAWMEDRIEVPRDWWPSWAGQSSPAWFLAIHMVDLFLWVAQTRGRRVFATGARKKLASIGVDAWDSISMHAELEGDISFQCQVCWILPDAFEAVVNQGMRIVGTEGMMEVDSQSRGAESCFASDGKMATYNLGFFTERRDKAGNLTYCGYGLEAITDFADNLAHVLGGGSLAELAGKYPSGYDGLEATKIVAAAHQSLDTGRTIDVT